MWSCEGKLRQKWYLWVQFWFLAQPKTNSWLETYFKTCTVKINKDQAFLSVFLRISCFWFFWFLFEICPPPPVSLDFFIQLLSQHETPHAEQRPLPSFGDVLTEWQVTSFHSWDMFFRNIWSSFPEALTKLFWNRKI